MTAAPRSQARRNAALPLYNRLQRLLAAGAAAADRRRRCAIRVILLSVAIRLRLRIELELDGMDIAFRTTLRILIMYALFFLPKATQTRIERWLRGKEDARKLSRADYVVVSFGKSGRTWLRVMLSRVYQVKHGLAERHLIAFDNLHNKVAEIPLIFFTHDNYLKDFVDDPFTKQKYYDKKVVLMVRDPADTAVSQYFQWKYRMTERKKRINDYPMDADVSLYDFVMMPQTGLPKIIDFMNGWARELGKIRNLMVVRYEDMRADPAAVLRKILEFLGTPGTPEEIAEAVRFASVENMRALEQKRVFWLSGRRMLAGDRSDPNTYKVRRAKVGGYRDDFTPEQQATIDRLVVSTLAPVFGYTERHSAGAADAAPTAPVAMPAARAASA
ncbi:MAG: sulfotransferase domain-containing protein [Rhodospirillales bacterium]|nr:sulfotransferase domain-containing protein [Rhodospirillales bacterium]